MKKILIVEDTPDNLEMMRVLFTAEGYDVCSATDGAEAVTLAESYRPDLIVMDIQLPVFDGYEATRRIKQIETLARTPVLAVTSYAMADDYQRCQAAGCDAYMVKPAMPRQILSKAKELLN
jgi:two-component system cell cycle response regulator DivK